jgi:ribosomal protein S18 acetylase RimI-like enzyme
LATSARAKHFADSLGGSVERVPWWPCRRVTIEEDGAVGEYTIMALTDRTWDAFADLCAKNNGAGMGGCWCRRFHTSTEAERRACGEGRAYKQRLVGEGRAHAALVFDGQTAVGWCQYGTPEELPGIFHRKEVESAGMSLPDYRLTCFFVDRRCRREGVATAALDGALRLIAAAGGGVVETYPRDTAGKKYSASFLYNVTRAMFEEAGFTYERPVGKNTCVMRMVIEPARRN